MVGSPPLHKRNPFLRKGVAALCRVPRMWSRLKAGEQSYRSRPPILGNSFPKSGTHLLRQILSALPGTVDYGTFLASTPSLTLREISAGGMQNKVRRLAPGELAAGHVFFDPSVEAALRQRNILQFFIYRDLRDVAVSEAHYLTHMNHWHRLHRYLAELSSEEERLAFVIKGIPRDELPVDYPDIASRFRRYEGWLHSDMAVPVRYEDLVGDGRRDAIELVAAQFASRSACALDLDEQVEACLAAIRPRESHTYRRGTKGDWRNSFSARNLELMKEVAGDLLVSLGYEENAEW